MSKLGDHPDVRPLVELWAVDDVVRHSTLNELRPEVTEVAYNVSGELLRHMRITVELSGHRFEIACLDHTPRGRDHGELLCEGVPGADLEALIRASLQNDPKKRPRMRVDLKVSCIAFLEDVLKEIGSSGGNLASPSAAARAALESHAPKLDADARTAKWSVAPKETVAESFALSIDSFEVQPSTDPTRAPEVRLVLVFDARPSDKASFVTKLIAADWSELTLAPSSKSENPAQAAYYGDRRGNIIKFLAANVDLAQGLAKRNGMVERGAKGSYPAVIGQLRQEIDEHLIVANYWSDTTEDSASEPYHALVSARLGMQTSHARMSSIVYMLRDIFGNNLPGALDLARVLKLTSGDIGNVQVPLHLEAGVGHCNEHSQAAFAILRELTPRVKGLEGAAKVAAVDADHTFVISNLRVETLSGKVDGQPTFDAKTAVRLPPLSEILDVYLDPSATPASMDDLVRRLDRGGKSELVFMANHPHLEPKPGGS